MEGWVVAYQKSKAGDTGRKGLILLKWVVVALLTLSSDDMKYLWQVETLYHRHNLPSVHLTKSK